MVSKLRPFPSRLLFVILLAVDSTIARAATLNVPGTYPTIASALAVSTSGDSVVIACGVYFESHLSLTRGITVRSETGDPNCVIIDAQDQGGFVGQSLVEMTILEGITISNAEEGGGAGLRCITDCTVRVSNCVFADSRATDGAGVAMAFGCAMEFFDCIFRNNHAELEPHRRGGAVYVNASRARFERCSFEQNGADLGAALYSFKGGEIEVLNCQFLGNSAVRGGAAHMESGSSLAAFESRFTGNTAENGGAIYLQEDSQVNIKGGSFEANSAVDSPTGDGIGGAIFARLGSSVQIGGTTFIGNVAGVGGAITSLDASHFELVESAVLHNHAESAGGLNLVGGSFSIQKALFWDNAASLYSGGAIQIIGASGAINSCTFHANGANSGSVIHAVGSKAPTEITSCILTQSVLGEVVSCGDGQEVSLRCSDVYGNAGGDWVGCLSGLEDADGNFSSDPQFCDPTTGNFQLQEGSPCAPEGHPECGLIGAFPVGCGSVSVSPASWGSIKALYR